MDSDTNYPPTFAEIAANNDKVRQMAAATRSADTIASLPPFFASPIVFDTTLTQNSPEPQSPKIDPEHPVVLQEGTWEFSPAFEELQDLVHVWYMMHPDIELYDWQAEELLRISGYPTGKRDCKRVHYNPLRAWRQAIRACNGSGKDLAFVSTIAVGMPLLYTNVFVVITSSSYEQLKFQTEAHIKQGILNLQRNLACKVYDSIEFYHVCEKRGGIIKLFCTDEGGRAEGWHPLHPKGRLVLIVNEAKSIPPVVFGALDRCDGYSHWIEVSSPGHPAGQFYDNCQAAVDYPAIPVPGRFYHRKIDYKDCPHKSEETRLECLRKHGEMSFIYQTSYLGNFYAQEETVVVSAALLEISLTNIPYHDRNDIGIGVDSAAGRDEHTIYVREGGALVFHKAFVQKDTVIAAQIISFELDPWKAREYVFKADDGGVSHGVCDNLTHLGWYVGRCLNNSPAHDKILYLNLGAEMYFHTQQLLRKGFIRPPDDKVLHLQLTSRRYTETENQGRKALMSKKKQGGKSPDRADGYVLCYASYRPDGFRATVPDVAPKKRMMTIDEFIAAAESDPDFVERLMQQNSQPQQDRDSTFTFQT